MARAENDKKVPPKKKVGDHRSAAQANLLVRYFRETRGELRRVTWPTREESLRLTAIVLAVTIAAGAYLFGFDALFSRLFGLLIDAVT